MSYPKLQMQWFVLTKGQEYMIVSVGVGCDPLYGFKSWHVHAGGFYGWSEACLNVPRTTPRYRHAPLMAAV